MASGSRPFVLLLKTLIALTVVYQFSLLIRSEKAFLSRPYIEDTFYALGVARSIAAGDGFSIDGVHPTNGVQPLICVLYAPLFAIAGDDMDAALRLVYAFCVLAYLFAAWMVAGFVRSVFRDDGERGKGDLIFWSVFGLVYINYSISVFYLNGLETALAGGWIFASLWYYAAKVRRESVSRRAHLIHCGLLGLLLGLGVLARIDVSFLCVAILISHFVRAHLLHHRLPGRERWGKFVEAVTETFIIGFVAVLVSSPWWIYNYMTFGSLMPISGQSQQWLSQRPIDSVIETFNALSDAFLPGIHTPREIRIGSYAPYGLVLVLFLSFIVALVPAIRRRLKEAGSRFTAEWRVESFLPLAIFSLLIVVFYTFFFRAPHFQARYLIVPVTTIRLGLFAFLFTLWGLYGSGSLVRKLIPALLFLSIAFSLVFFTRNFESDYNNIFVNAIDWIEDHVGPNEKVGMFQSGTTGFVYPDRVVNLDGKVNADAWNAFKDGRLPQYVDSIGFDYFIDWDIYTERIFSDPALRAKYRRIDSLPADIIVWQRIER